jgi:hypothetical protein
MKVLDIFDTLHHQSKPQPLLSEQIEHIRTECSDFLVESNRMPVYKHIPREREFVKLKARFKRTDKHDTFSESFNNAFTPKLRQRAVFAHGTPPESTIREHLYYIFPTNGYQYVFNTQITDSTVYENIMSNIGDNELFEHLLQQNYSNKNLTEGIASGAEILFHGIPYCYGVNTTCFESYKELLSVF